jgi:hypothetical protein
MSVEVNKSLGATPNPGSDAAIEAGCRCPVLGNGHGRGYMGIAGLFLYVESCPVHSDRKQSKVTP